jgi:hypothetical protein
VTIGSSRLRMHTNQYELKVGASRKMEAFKGTLIVIRKLQVKMPKMSFPMIIIFTLQIPKKSGGSHI